MKAGPWVQCWRLAMARPGLFWGSMGLYTVFYCLPLVSGLVMRAIFDALSGHAPAGLNVWALIGAWVGNQLAVAAVIFFSVWVWTSLNTLSGALIRANMMGWLVHGPGPKSVPTTPGEALSRFRDDVFETLQFLESWIDTGGQAVFCVIALTIMFSINPAITSAVILPMMVVGAVTGWVTGRIHYYRRLAREAAARVTSFIGEMFTGVQAIRVAGAEDRMLAHLADLGEARRKTAVTDRLYIAYLDALGAGSASLGVGLVLLLAAGAMHAHTFSVGDFTLFASYVGWASAAPRWVGRLLARHRTADVALTRVQTIMKGADPLAVSARQPPRAEPVPRHSGLAEVRVSGLSYRHPSSERGIIGADFTLRKGQVTVVTGRVGSGKSTLIRSFLGLIPNDAGEVLWNGERVADLATFMAPPRVAYTAQAPRLFSEPLRDNILMGAAATDEELLAAIQLAILEPDIAQLDAGLETFVGTRGVTLSGGQLQRTAAARMFVRDTDLVVFDDVSSALDVKTEQQFWTRFFSSGDRTCLAVSHRREAFRHADEILVMDEGRIAARGTLKSLLAESALFRHAWEHTEQAHAPV